MRWTWQCVFLVAVTLSSTDRWDGSSSPSSAAWLTSAMPSTGCHLAFCGQDASPTGWWDWWAPSRLWLDWSRWTQAAVIRQTLHNYLIFMNEWKCWWKILNERMSRTLINVIRCLANHQWKAKKNPISQISFFAAGSQTHTLLMCTPNYSFSMLNPRRKDFYRQTGSVKVPQVCFC